MITSPLTLKKVTVAGETYDLAEMTDEDLSYLYLELFFQAAEASDRHNRHGWAGPGGEAAYRSYQAENFLARQAIEAEEEARARRLAQVQAQAQQDYTRHGISSFCVALQPVPTVSEAPAALAPGESSPAFGPGPVFFVSNPRKV